MLVMSKEKSPGRPKRVRKGYHLNVYVDPLIGEAFEVFLERHEPRTDKTGGAEFALKKMLTDFGYYPPPRKEADTT